MWGWDSHSRKWDLRVLRDSRKFKVRLQRSKHFILKKIFISLESYWSVDVQNGFAWPIWTFATKVMAKRKARKKLPTTATTLVQTSSWSEVRTKSYSPAKLWTSQPWWFRDSHLGVPGQKAIWMPLPRTGAKYIIWGKLLASPESGPWWVLWVQSCPWLVLAPKVTCPQVPY